MSLKKRLERTVEMGPRHVASASFDYAHAARRTDQRPVAELRYASRHTYAA